MTIEKLFKMGRRNGHCLEVGHDSSQQYWKVYHEHDRKYMGAHRFVYEHFYGPIPQGKRVCHTCDNMRCVEPAHLYAGTAAQNTQDIRFASSMPSNVSAARSFPRQPFKE